MKHELKIIYNSEKKSDRETYAVLKAISIGGTDDLDVQYNALTETELDRLASQLQVKIGDLFDKESDKYSKEMTMISDADQLLFLQADATLLKTPIIIRPDGIASFVPPPTVVPEFYKSLNYFAHG